MKVLQINAWLGHLLHPLIALIENERPDIVCMQEVLHSHEHHPLFDSFNTYSSIKDLFDYGFFSPTFSFESLGTTVELGNAIFSNQKMSDQKTIFINGNYQKSKVVDHYTRNIRNLQTCRISTSTTNSISVANHHGFHDLNPMGNDKSVECIKKVIQELRLLDSSFIFCGDLNVSPKSKPIELIEKTLDVTNNVVEASASSTLSPVFRVPEIEVVCDYIFTSRSIRTRKFVLPDNIVSDHKALVLEFDV